MAGLTLFRQFVLRRLAREPLRSATTTAGIALGVAVIIAIQLTNASSIAGFETALNAVSGRTSLEIVSAGSGVDERRLSELTWLREFGDLAPVIEGDVTFTGKSGSPDTLRVLGVDILRDQPFRDYRLIEWDVAAAGGAQARRLHWFHFRFPRAADRSVVGHPARGVRGASQHPARLNH